MNGKHPVPCWLKARIAPLILNAKTISSFGYCTMSLGDQSIKPVHFRCDYCYCDFVLPKRQVLSRRKILEKDTCGKSVCKGKKIQESQRLRAQKQSPIQKGMTFGSWTIISESFYQRTYSHRIPHRRIVKVKCNCGNIKVVLVSNLKQHTSCRCRWLKKGTFPKSARRLRDIWHGMKYRCYNTKSYSYRYYGAKGIKVCKKWHNFLQFYQWAICHGYNSHLTIERRNPTKNYCPQNCEWITLEENSRRSHTWRRREIEKLSEENTILKRKIAKYKEIVEIKKGKVYI